MNERIYICRKIADELEAIRVQNIIDGCAVNNTYDAATIGMASTLLREYASLLVQNLQKKDISHQGSL